MAWRCYVIATRLRKGTVRLGVDYHRSISYGGPVQTHFLPVLFFPIRYVAATSAVFPCLGQASSMPQELQGE